MADPVPQIFLRGEACSLMNIQRGEEDTSKMLAELRTRFGQWMEVAVGQEISHRSFIGIANSISDFKLK